MMKWKQIKLPRWPLVRMPWRRPEPAVMRKLALVGLALLGMVGAFYWGRQGGRNEARAQQPQVPNLPLDAAMRPGSGSDYSRRVVAYIFGSVPITREDLGEYLIERVGAERIDFLVNRRIIEMTCNRLKVAVTDTEIQAQLAEDLKGFQCSEKDFVDKVLRKYNKTLFEWKEDVIRPKLCLQHLVQDRITVTEEDIQKGFEAKYGEKVRVRVIVLSKDQAPTKYALWERIKKEPAQFDKEATSQFIGPLAAEGGKIPPIHRHYSDPKIEAEAFKLQPGDISPILDIPDGTTLIMKCEERIPPDTSKHVADERMTLYKEIADMRLATEIPKVFQQLRNEANPQIFLKRDLPSATNPAGQVARASQQGLQMPSGGQTAGAAAGSAQPTGAAASAVGAPNPGNLGALNK